MNDAGQVDVHDVPAFDVWRTMVEEHEGLVRAIFPRLGSLARPAGAPGGETGP